MKKVTFDRARLVFIINGLEHQLIINNGSFGTSTLWRGTNSLGRSSDRAPARESSFLNGTFEPSPELEALNSHLPIDAILYYESQNDQENRVRIKILGMTAGNSFTIAFIDD